MNGILSEKRFYSSSSSGTMRVEVFAPVAGQEGEYRRLLFPLDTAELMELDDAHSCLITQSGVSVPVALSFDKLYEALFQSPAPRSNKIDLTLVTGAAAASARPLTLSAAFHPKAKVKVKDREAPDPDIKLMAINGSDRKKMITIKASNIRNFQKNPYNSGATQVYLKEAVEDMSSFNIDIHENTFKERLAEALREGHDMLDLMPGHQNLRQSPPRKP